MSLAIILGIYCKIYIIPWSLTAQPPKKNKGAGSNKPFRWRALQLYRERHLDFFYCTGTVRKRKGAKSSSTQQLFSSKEAKDKVIINFATITWILRWNDDHTPQPAKPPGMFVEENSQTF